MKLLSVFGARPQFIKLAMIARAVERLNSLQRVPLIEHVLVNTGQHYDYRMSGQIAAELALPSISHNLEIGGLESGRMVGQMISKASDLIAKERPDCVLVFGDTDSALSGALAAVKNSIPTAHVEAGVRSYDSSMPEEINRTIIDRVSKHLFVPCGSAIRNLEREGIVASSNENGELSIINCGDVMYDASIFFAESAAKLVSLDKWGLKPSAYCLATLHRAENVDNPNRLKTILLGLGRLAENQVIVLPIHPRTKKRIEEFGFHDYLRRIMVVDPLSYLECQKLLTNASTVLTDSGGIQKEAFFARSPCVTLRDQTEWTETVDSGWNVIVGANADHIVAACRPRKLDRADVNPFGRGNAADLIVDSLLKKFS